MERACSYTVSSCHRRLCAGPQRSPGGKAAPGVFLLTSATATVAVGYTALRGTPIWPWVWVCIALFAAIQIPISMTDNCSQGKDGVYCSKCKAVTPLRPWSL